VDEAVARERVAGREMRRASLEIGDDAAGLLDNHDARLEIPRPRAALPNVARCPPRHYHVPSCRHAAHRRTPVAEPSIRRESSRAVARRLTAFAIVLACMQGPSARAQLSCDEGPCDDGIDNDGDALVDCDDPGCCDIFVPLICGFYCQEVGCDDGVDNDRDGLVDLDDVDCCEFPGSALECQEITCGDGIDNDVDGLVDCADECCRDAIECGVVGQETSCTDGVDNDLDGLIDCADAPECCFGPGCADRVLHLARLLPTRPGLAVMTLALETARTPAVLLLDVSCPEANAPGVGRGWPVRRDYNQDDPSEAWTLENLGTPVFGIAVDHARAPNIYVTSSSLYIPQPGYPADGSVFRLCGATGAICRVADLPNAQVAPLDFGGPGLGNVAYDDSHHQLFVTNFEDGRIYRLPLPEEESCDCAGFACETPNEGPFDAFDPFGADDGMPGFAPLGERLWGVGVQPGRVYFGRWNENGHLAGVSSGVLNEIWSVGLTPNGEFDRALGERLEVSIPLGPYCGHGPTGPPSDIEFAEDGRMLVAERTLRRDMGFFGAHDSRVLEFELRGPAPQSWDLAQVVEVGNFFGWRANAAGGADYAQPVPPGDCPPDGHLLATGDSLRWPVAAPCPADIFIYGVQVSPLVGGTRDNSYLIDADGHPCGNHEKAKLGDVDYLRQGDVRPGPCDAVDCCVLNEAPPAFLDGPADVVVECGSPLPALPAVHAESACSPLLDATYLGQDPPVPPQDCPYALTRTWSAMDSCAREARWTQVITVDDTLPPRLVSSATRTCLWPPNHRYACFGREVFAPVIRDDCDEAPTWRFAGCASDQCDDAPCAGHPGENGDGATVEDCIGTDDGICVRSERAGTEPEGRTYAVTVVMTDRCGNEALAEIGSVYVPHDQSPHEDCARPERRQRGRGRR